MAVGSLVAVVCGLLLGANSRPSDSARGSHPSFEREFIFTKASFASCHASTIVQAPDGHLIAAWFGGSAEGAHDVGIYVSHYRLPKAGTRGKWSRPERVQSGVGPDGSSLACYNPVLFQPNHGPLMLFYKVGSEPSKWIGFLSKSEDNGRTWSFGRPLPPNILGPIKNKPIELRDGTIFCGSSEEAGGWRVHMESTRDFGQTWTRTAALNDPRVIGAIQPSLLGVGGDSLEAIGRTQQGRLFRIESKDLGRTWGPMSLTHLPNPNSGTDALTLQDGRQLLVYNPVSQGRTPLAVAVSPDGVHWKDVVTLERQPGEYSYPAVIQSSDGKIHITYTWRRLRIVHAILDPSTLGTR